MIGMNEAKQKAKIASLSNNKSPKHVKQQETGKPNIQTQSHVKSVSSRHDDESNEEEGEENDVEYDSNDSEEEDEEEYGSDEEDDDGSEVDNSRHNKLVNAINRFSNVDEDEQRQKRLQHQYASLSESSVIGSGMNLNSSSTGLGLNALFDHIGDAAGMSAMKSQLKDLEKPSAAPKYVERVVANRIEREETYAANKEDITKWQETVIQNRAVGTLDLAQDKRRPHKAKTLVNTFVPTTDFEKEIQMVMLQHGATDEATEKKERELLDSSKFSPEEIAQRTSELAKVRALLFYEQMKRHRMNKIKSKAYRAIKRKAKQKLEMDAEAMADEIGDQDDEEGMSKDEKAAMQRIRERMNLKHKNTSKWARMALKFGHTDKSLRDAYHESVRMGHDLTRKMDEDVNANRLDEDDDDEYELNDAGSEEDENGNSSLKKRRSVLSQAKAELQQVLASSSGAELLQSQGKYKKLFEMDFMKRASDVQQERAKEEARDVLKELAALEEEGYDSDSPMLDREEEAAEDHAHMILSTAPVITKKHSVTTKPSGVSLSVSSTLPTKSDTDVKSSSSVEKQAKKEEPAATESNPWLEDDVARTNSNVRSNITKESNSSKKANGSIAVATQINMKVQASADGSTIESTNTSGKNKASKLAENAPSNTHNTKKNGDKKLPSQPPSNDKGTDVAKNTKRKRSDSVTSTTSGTKKAEEATAPNAIVKKRQLIESTQEELVRMAFAGPDYEKDFQLQKDQEISRELGLNDKKMKVAKDGK